MGESISSVLHPETTWL